MNQDNMLNSGGAAGADSVFAQVAYHSGHKCTIHSFHGHYMKLGASHFPDKIRYQVIKYTKSQLDAIVQHPLLACDLLSRQFNIKSGNTFYYLTRDYYIISKVDRVYAVGYLNQDKKKSIGVDGGTGVTCQMFALRYKSVLDVAIMLPLYLYCQKNEKWFQCKYHSVTETYEWIPIDKPPKPTGNYAGIGSRELTSRGEQEIKLLYQS